MTTIVYLPVPVRVKYDDTPFYDMFSQYDDPEVVIKYNYSSLIDNALHYIKIIEWNPVKDMPSLTREDIELFCAVEILDRIIKKFAL